MNSIYCSFDTFEDVWPTFKEIAFFKAESWSSREKYGCVKCIRVMLEVIMCVHLTWVKMPYLFREGFLKN